MATKLYRKLLSGCPICGKLYCKFYGYSKSDKKWIVQKLRAKEKQMVKENYGKEI